MRAWTDGEKHILLDEEGLHVWGKDRVATYADFALGDRDVDGALAVGNQGKEAWVRAESGATARVDLDEQQVTEFDWTLLDASYTRRRLLVARAVEDEDDDRGWSTDIGFFNVEIKRFDELELPEPKRVEWPGLIWDDAPWADFGFGEAKSKSPDPDSFRFTTNRHGVALSDRDSGIVAVVPNRRDTFQWAIRLPAEKKLRIFAVPTRKGALVSVKSKGGASALIHFDDTGRVQASRAFWNLGPSVLLDPGRILVPAAETYGEGKLVLRVVSLDTMADVAILAGDVDSKGSMTTDVAADIRSFVYGIPGKFWRGVLEAGSWRLESDLIAVREMRQAAQAKAKSKSKSGEEEEEEGYRPEFVEDGDPAVDFALIDEAPPVWKAKADSTFEFGFKLRSSGVEGEGLIIELSGDAVKKDLADFLVANVDGVEAEFERNGDRWTVDVSAMLPPGLKYPYIPEPAKKERPEAREWMEKTQFDVTVRGKAKAKGSELLRVEARSRTQDETIRWMRPLTVK